MAEPSDEELCGQVGQGDARAFELLVERHQFRAYRLAVAMLGNEADARDVSQEAFLRVYQSARSFDQRARFTTWFHRILVNLCIDQQRRQRWWRKGLSLSSEDDDPDQPAIDPPTPEPGPDARAMWREALGQLNDVLARLSPKQRAAVLLHVEGEFSGKEIAAVLKCSENTARVHLHRAVTALRKALRRW